MNQQARALGILAMTCALIASTAQARGAPQSAQNPATADALFAQALELLAKREYPRACALFLKTYELDSSTPGALHGLAECYAGWGQKARALNRYRQYIKAVKQLPEARRSAHDERVKAARAQIDAFSPETSDVTLILPSSAPPDTRVTLDGDDIDTSTLERPWAVEPGEHRVTTKVPGGKTAEETFSTKKGQTMRVVLKIRLPGEKSGADAENSRGSGQRAAGVVSLVVGGAGVAVGAITGVLVFEKKPAIEDGCTARLSDGKVGCRDQVSLDAADSAKTLGTMSTLALIGGGVGIALGTVLVLTAPSEPKRAAASTCPWIAVRAGALDGAGVGVTVRGVF